MEKPCVSKLSHRYLVLCRISYVNNNAGSGERNIAKIRAVLLSKGTHESTPKEYQGKKANSPDRPYTQGNPS